MPKRMPKTAPKIRVLLVEDNRLLREGITKMLNAEPDIKVVASAGNGDTYEKARRLVPQVVLLDMGLRNHDSVDVAERLKKEFPDVQLIVMDLIPAHAEMIQFVRAGVAGFLLKDATLQEFVNTIRSVASGTKVLPPPLVGSLFSQIVEHAVQGGKMGQLLSAVKLTSRERDVIAHIAAGRSNKEIASELNIAVYTVKSHVHNILEKLALHTRLEIATFAHTQRELPGSLPSASTDPTPQAPRKS